MIIWNAPLPTDPVRISLKVKDNIERSRPVVTGPNSDDIQQAKRILARATGLQGHLLPEMPTAVELNAAIAKNFEGAEIILQTFQLEEPIIPEGNLH